MPQALIHLEEEEDKKLKDFSRKWNISKHDVIKRMVREYKDTERGKK